MGKEVLCVGHCSADLAALRRYLESHFDVTVHGASFADSALARLQSGTVDLVLVNRIFDADGHSGLEFLQRLRAEPQHRDLAVMLITNYPQHQQQALAAGAAPGFGKAHYDDPETLSKLAGILGPPRDHAAE